MTTLAIRVCAAAAGLAFIISLIVTRFVRQWAITHGWVDRPGALAHKQHAQPVAMLGGVAIVASVLLPMLAALLAAHLLHASNPAWLPRDIMAHLPGNKAKTRVARLVIGGGMVLHIMGLVDDVRPLGAGRKLLVQLLVAATVVLLADLRLLTIAGPAGSAVLSILWIVVLTNSFNFLDNMDGLATGVAAIVAVVYCATAARAGQLFVPACCALLAGGLLGFLPYNFNPATIFLGDAGSLVVGYLIAVLTIMTTFYDAALGETPAGVLAPLVVMSVPLYDTGSVFLLRWREGRPLWQGDRRHFSHRLQRRGLSVREAVGVIWLATCITALPATLLPTATWPLAIGIFCQALAVVVLVAFLEKSA